MVLEPQFHNGTLSGPSGGELASRHASAVAKGGLRVSNGILPCSMALASIKGYKVPKIMAQYPTTREYRQCGVHHLVAIVPILSELGSWAITLGIFEVQVSTWWKISLREAVAKWESRLNV